MKKVLVVAYYFPPIGTSGSLRPLGFCRYLEEFGWQPRVLTTQFCSVYPTMPRDEHLSRRLPAGLQVHRVSHANPLRKLIHARDEVRRRFRATFLNEPTEPKKDIGEKIRYSHSQRKLSRWKDLVQERFFSFPDPQCFWLRPALHQIFRLARSERPDVVVATGKPWTSLFVGEAVARKFDVPFIADFRDPWVRNPSESLVLIKAARKLERQLCSAAERVISTTPELTARFAADYPDLGDRFITITNGFDKGSGGLRILPKRLHTRSESTCSLELSHFGTIYGNRNPEALFYAIKELLGEGKIARGKLRVRFVGEWDAGPSSNDALVKELEREGVIIREQPVPHDVCLRQMALAKVLLILQPGYPLQIPGKIYEYLATGRPLLVVGGEGATANLVNRYRLGICCRNQVSEIKSLLLKLVNGSIKFEPSLSSDIERFDYRNLTGELASVLDFVYRKRQMAPEGSATQS